jgi:transposase InsO family protein
MVIDYSQTINRFTQLDAYPLPKISELVNTVAHYHVFSTLDLKSAYHQIPLLDDDKAYTAFEANGRLFQFLRIPFGLTNAVAQFQRIMDNFIRENGLLDTYAYVDNILICGKTQDEHDKNFERFSQAAKKARFTFNQEKSVLSVRSIDFLGYSISHGSLQPDPERLKPLKDMPVPNNIGSLRRILGLFSYYSPWISRYSDKIRPLVKAHVFPLNSDAVAAFQLLKDDICSAAIQSVDESIPFTVETDASDYAIAATLNQLGRPVAFYSRTLTPSETRHSSVEKEAYAIVEALRKWKHYLAGRHFTLITDQRAVAFMFNSKIGGKVKNDKILRWRIELSCYHYDIVYRPGTENLSADALSRSSCATTIGEGHGKPTLLTLHESLCHPGVTRMIHYVRVKNLPFSTEDVKKVCSSCKICLELKPKFYKPPRAALIKATQPFERLSIDFKGPLPSASRNKYILTVIDEYSRFPFAFPCPDVAATTVVKCLHQLFCLFGMPAYIHSDRGASFMSAELRNFLHARGVATSRTSPYNPQGNGQCERYNGIVWTSVLLALKSKELLVSQWENVLPEVLHSLRSLLCTATNVTPHERLFCYPRRSSYGCSLPSWLSTPGPVYLKRMVRHSKHEPFVDEVELLDANHQYAHVRFPDGRESTVSTRHLAPAPTDEYADDEKPQEPVPLDEASSPFLVQSPEAPRTPLLHEADVPREDDEGSLKTSETIVKEEHPCGMRRSTRIKRTPAHLEEYRLE